MKLEEAIGILAAKKLDDVERNARDSAQACQLGIEALKRIEHLRGYSMTQVDTRLPGETED